MKNKINWSPEARRDLDAIYDYICDELQNPIAARSAVDGIIKSVAQLKDFSGIGAKVFFPGELDSGCRFVRYKNYLAFYRAEKDAVFVDRILYGKSDYMRVLFGN